MRRSTRRVLQAFSQKRLRIGSSEISEVYRATQSVSSDLESDSCIGKLGNNEMQEGSGDEDSYIEKTEDDDADRSLLYCMILSEDGRIDLNSTDWYGRLTNIRQTYKMKHRSREKDILTIKSKIGTHPFVNMIENVVMCYVNTNGFWERGWAFQCLTFNNDYDKFFKVTPPEVLRKCVPYMTNIQETILCSSEISDIVLKFGLDFVCFFHTCSKYSKIYEDGLNILNLPRQVVDMVDNDDDIDEFSEFKQYVDEIMKCEHKSLKSLNLNSLLGSYLIGRETGKEKEGELIRICLSFFEE
ncbi:uncharacterized protein LOC134282977 [Saccostrea cucullata]|uniref:uncharacterized protein LOC134282977 n=1 Tax=Saccostrea cuccullata TaxID=36930 RepID=UPI002ED13732